MHRIAGLHKSYGTIQEERPADEKEKTDAPEIVSVKRAMQFWKLGAICSKTEKRTLAATYMTDALTSKTPENMRIPLQGLRLTTIPNAPFASSLFIANLKQLNLSENALSSFPTSILHLTNLEGLSLADNNLTEIPADIKKLKKLSVLVLSGNKIEQLPEAIGELPNLETLGVSRNKLTTLPKSIGKLQLLKTLYAFGNQIQTLPAEIGQLHATTIYIYGNKLEVLPEEFVNNKELKELDISSNNLKSLPKYIGNLTQLYQLGICGNKELADLPDSLEKCFYITILNVEDTKITKERKWHFLETWDALKDRSGDTNPNKPSSSQSVGTCIEYGASCLETIC